MDEKVKKENEKKQGISAYSFMVEVICKPKEQKHFIVRVPLPNGGTGIACYGFYKELIQFLDSL